MWTQRPQITTTMIIGIFLFALPFIVDAACTRADVEFYLDKGFSQKQITTICSAGETDPAELMETSPPEEVSPLPASTKPTENRQPQAQQQPAQSDFRHNETDLAVAIQGYDVKIDSETLGYTLEECIEYGNEDLFGFKDKACPAIRYTINLNGMEVVRSSRKMLFFGTGEIRVRGNIDRKILNGLSKLKTAEKQLFKKQLEDGNETVIPVREGIPLKDVEATLLKLAR